jgi:hypothetical protein
MPRAMSTAAARLMALKPYWDIDNNQTYDANIDKTFADLRVWVDANSNGVTDGGELKTLAALNIVSIGTGKTAVNVADENGNLNTFKGNYTTSSGEVIDGTRSFNLLQNTFHRDWPNSPNIPPDVAALPNMQAVARCAICTKRCHSAQRNRWP